MHFIRPNFSLLRHGASPVPVRQLEMIPEFGVSDVPIYGRCPRFRAMVPPVSKFVVTSISGPEAPAYEATVVTIIVLLGNRHRRLPTIQLIGR